MQLPVCNVYNTGLYAKDRGRRKREKAPKNLSLIHISKLILVTAHRRENIGEPMKQMFRAIRKLVEDNDDVKVIYPIHKNPEVRKIAYEVLGNMQRIRIVEPLDLSLIHI